ncbi:hypothetical protein Q5752_003734 [Cryptotrichosporon argae]
MHLLGHHLPDHKLVRIALTSFYGISTSTSSRLLARLQIPLSTRVSSLSEPQITALSAFLSSPSTSTPPPATPLAVPPGAAALQAASEGKSGRAAEDPLNALLIETDLRRGLQADIGHHRVVGTYRGRRHAMGLPVRGQNTRTNARTARKLNSVHRRHLSSFALPSLSMPAIPRPPSAVLRLLGLA